MGVKIAHWIVEIKSGDQDLTFFQTKSEGK